ncbi:hypothetical protein [Oceanospirillum sediminis]|uniref:Uncharacterized protein n=1 Tax=Oceanospirillum sediminis TaxID=2760088 RepID=A0A839IY09_9GAMM|nr:hypothetical protein [Oceanospirillum sediminis]MBB1489570.1 hypothetical protein [Oceanospirillum sediminis]
MNIDEIKSKLNSSDAEIEVLSLCEKFLDEKIEQENNRARLAEQRTSTLLNTLGASAAFLVFAGSELKKVSFSFADGSWFIIFLFSFSLLYIFRSVYYSIRSIQVGFIKRTTPESIFELQEKNKEEALKDVLAGKLWELKNIIHPNTTRLFYVQRAQRALVLFFSSLLLTSIFAILNKYGVLYSIQCALIVCAFLMIPFYFLVDKLIEKNNGWNH